MDDVTVGSALCHSLDVPKDDAVTGGVPSRDPSAPEVDVVDDGIQDDHNHGVLGDGAGATSVPDVPNRSPDVPEDDAVVNGALPDHELSVPEDVADGGESEGVSMYDAPFGDLNARSSDLDGKFGGDHTHSHRLLQRDRLPYRGHSLGTHRTADAHSRMDHACGSAMDGELGREPDPSVDALARQDLAVQTLDHTTDYNPNNTHLHSN